MGKCCAVIVAAGNSSRMGPGLSKQFIPICGVPVIVWALKAFEAAGMVNAVVAVCRGSDKKQLEGYITEYGIKKVISVVAGGATRQESAAAGAAAVPEGYGYIAVHDGARPLVTPEEIDFCIKDCLGTGASALGVPLKDTVKKIDAGGFVVSTPERSGIVTVQTPQVFEYSLYMKALAEAEKSGGDYSDDCQLIEHIGAKVHICAGSYGNIKITTPEDVYFAEALLKRGKCHG